MRPPVLAPVFVALLALGCGGRPTVDPADAWPADATGPAAMGPGVRVFSGVAATLLESRSCSNGEGDHWCTFVGRSSTEQNNLFVLNVSAVIAGVPVSCGAPDPNCLLLTESLGANSSDFHPTYFDGDTLVYYDDEFSAYAWRPGMEAGRLLAAREGTRDIAFCTPAERGTAVACLAIPFDQPDTSLVAADLYAGSADGESEPLLAPIESVIAATAEDTPSVHRFGFGALADGYVAWSSRETADGPEVLKLQRVDDPDSRITVASDVHRWAVRDDGGGWLWIRDANEIGIGTLETASFPNGENPRDVLGEVIDFSLNRSGSVVARTYDSDAVSISDPRRAPDAQVLIDTEVGDIVTLSDQGHIAYTKRFVNNVYNDLIVASLDGRRSCVLETTGSYARSVHFAPGAETVLWARANGDGYDAYHSRSDDCTTVALSPGVVVLGWIGRGHAVFIDEFDDETSTGSLRYKKISKHGAVDRDPPALIADHAGNYAVWGPDFLLYTVSSTPDADGVYVRAFGHYAGEG